MGPDRDRSLDLKSDTHLQPDASPTALRGPAHLKTEVRNEKSEDYLQRVVKIWNFGRLTPIQSAQLQGVLRNTIWGFDPLSHKPTRSVIESGKKSKFWSFDLVNLKPACSATESSKKSK